VFSRGCKSEAGIPLVTKRENHSYSIHHNVVNTSENGVEKNARHREAYHYSYITFVLLVEWLKPLVRMAFSMGKEPTGRQWCLQVAR
jgi:hypothetical protein